MKKFFIKSLLLVFIVGGLLFLASNAYKQTNTYKNVELADRTNTYHSMPASIDVAVFGASHGMFGLKSGPEGSSFFNFSLSAQVPPYDLCLMRQYKDRIAPGGLVILTVSYLSPFWQETEEVFASKQDRYYRILSPENIIRPNITQFILKRFFPILTEDLLDLIRAFLFDPGVHTPPEDQIHMNPSIIPSEEERILRDHWGVITPVFPNTEPKMMDAYRQMLTMCQEHGWTAVLVTTPYLQVYNDFFPAEFYPVFYNAVDSLCDEFDVPYLDYSHDEEFAENYDLFLNVDHLNTDGAAVFAPRLYADLQEQGIWPNHVS